MVITPLVGVLSTEMIFHPERNQFAILGWRSPYTGRISIELRLRFPDPAGQAKSNGIMWSINRDNSSLRRELLTPTAVAQTAIPLDINQGDTIYLVIEDAGDADFDSTVGTLRMRTLH